ncbi:restriction endonuclease subunit M [Tetragenococcus halophilus subsp. flandriensis]|uniref:DNA adenine methylase n=1 Tax=Tetragenococcus halophilus TaxID=51669 RepID=UPI0023E9E1DB|nr:Dam family site-specific DNA-(adenine-N6)-methyltransferase [Tetragenococcus halophilus]GMA08933.1 restriction endonuclease subunit M [Tetragenococcus halophilus subsp. flandriensis]
MENEQQAKPIIKWAGGKFKLSDLIIKEGLERFDMNNFDRYVEPFIGGGGMFFSMTNKFNFGTKIISDVNEELINMYIQIRDNASEVLKITKSIEESFNVLENDDKKKEFYLDLREKFNEGIKVNELDETQASLFIALNKLGFNGLYRVNKHGLFNVPFGQKKKAALVEENNLVAVSNVLQSTEIKVADFRDCEQYANERTLFYFDSPYRPLPNSASFTSYAKLEFNDESQKDLAATCKKVVDKGGKFLLSNSDPTQIDPNDTFFDDLYSSFDIVRIPARRAIGATASRRGVISEILVIG